MTELPNIPNAKVYFDHNDESCIRIRVQADADAYWMWCCENLVTGQWQSLIPLIGNTATYIFKNGADASAFKLRFNV